MADTTTRTGSAGLPPSNIIAANTYNPMIGDDTDHPLSYPPGTPVVQSTTFDKTVVPARANAAATATSVGLTAVPAVVGNHGLVQFAGPLTLETAQWDAVTGGTGGLVRGAAYYVQSGFPSGRLTVTPPSAVGTFVTPVGVALSETELMIQLQFPKAN